MSDFAVSTLGRLRALVGNRLLLVPGVRIVIENANGEVLLQKRSDFGVWGLPGGNAEEGEGLDTAIMREVAEETGLRVTDLIPFGFGCDPRLETVTFPNGDRCQFFVLNYFTRSFRGTAKVSDAESTAVGWFTPARLPEMLPSMRASVEGYGRFQRTGTFQMI